KASRTGEAARLGDSREGAQEDGIVHGYLVSRWLISASAQFQIIQPGARCAAETLNRGGIMLRLLADRFLLALLGVVALSTVLPVRGALVEPFSIATDIAIALVFFLQGARLSRATVIAGFTHWRLHLMVFAATFVLFPLLGLTAGLLVPTLLSPALFAGILF